ncbi:hypothetical protein HMPREF1983_01444 [Gemella bergeri ATCC 700627]|uniref:Uncharacterized protein n=1 Tax=Gemella bergeri ATCC 700627 TaxID=1321820 RepID=U2S094_9BACL|nr:hypothetical protein [Gemella bergeri]ERK56257.1 hypothetical protein HMPREF1983_01444 [Gemella bergeri ATCC 700627]
MDYCISIEKELRDTAGIKAPEDISNIAKKRGIGEILFPKFPTYKSKFYQKAWLFFVVGYNWLKMFWKLKKGDRVIFQHPMYGVRVANFFIPKLQKYKKIKFIAVIHDLESLRKGIDGVIKNNQHTNKLADTELLKKFDKIICHNIKMHNYLVEAGIEEEKLEELQIFDYLSEIEPSYNIGTKYNTIVIAGNLAEGKSSYIYDLIKNSKKVMFNLYGPNLKKEKLTDNAEYVGSFPPNDLIKNIKGDFGLVWDGISLETCTGNTGEYLKFNNPHKTSLYLAAGLPVIVWKEAAISDFIKDNNLGFTVSNLSELEEKLISLDIESYSEILENVKSISQKIREGYYFGKVLDKTLSEL